MAFVSFENVWVEFPVYDVQDRSFKNKLLSSATGGIIKSQGTSCLVQALRGITFELKEGDRIGLMGHNGAGKSTLLRTLNRIYIPTQGTAVIEGATSSLINLSLGVDLDATGQENIFIRGALMGLSRQLIASQLDEIIHFSDLGEAIHLPVRTYSSGMQMRLAFSVAVLCQPDILIMDEWLSVGDAAFQKKAEERLSLLVENTKILVLASHNPQLLESTCTHVMWLHQGQIQEIGRPSTVIKNFLNSSLF